MKQQQSSSALSQRIILIGVIISVVIVVISLFTYFFFNPEAVAKRDVAYLAKDYYETYFYDNFASTIKSGQYKVTFEKYKKTGFAAVPLRRLLSFDNNRNKDYARSFTGDSYNCDLETSKIIFYPEEPYGRNNYRVEYNLDCHYED